MAFTETLTPYFADFGEAVTVNGVAARAIFDSASELVLFEFTTATMRCCATSTVVWSWCCARASACAKSPAPDAIWRRRTAMAACRR